MVSAVLLTTSFRVLLGSFILSYLFYTKYPREFEAFCQNIPSLHYLKLLFSTCESISPFHEYIVEDLQKSKEILLTPEQLSKYDGSPNSLGLYLALLGQVFDVSKGRTHYGPEGGYSFFTGKDASRAFVSGQFDEEGLIDEVSNLSFSDYLGLKEWLEFYHSDYVYIGKLIGRYYDQSGKETPYGERVKDWIRSAVQESDRLNIEKKTFPPCNSEWSSDKGHRVWCTNRSGGIERSWIGVPRRLFYPGQKERCACVRNVGPSTHSPKDKTNIGDLANLHLKEYENCPPIQSFCILPE